MSIFNTIKQAIVNIYIKLELKDNTRERVPIRFNFNEIKTVGILFDATNPEEEVLKSSPLMSFLAASCLSLVF